MHLETVILVRGMFGKRILNVPSKLDKDLYLGETNL